MIDNQFLVMEPPPEHVHPLILDRHGRYVHEHHLLDTAPYIGASVAFIDVIRDGVLGTIVRLVPTDDQHLAVSERRPPFEDFVLILLIFGLALVLLAHLR